MRKYTKLTLTILIMVLLTACSNVDKEAWQEQYDLGMKYLEEGNYEEAVIAFTKAIEIDVKSAVSYVGRGDAYTGFAKQTDDLEQAKEYFEKALQDYEEAENLGSDEVEYKKAELEKLLEEVIGKIAEAVEREKELLKQKEELKQLFEPLYNCFVTDDIEGAVELMRAEEYIEFNSSIKDKYVVLYENEGSEMKLVTYPENYYYFGEFVNGARIGNGLWLKSYEKGLEYRIYEGEWENDLPNGEGKILEQYPSRTEDYRGEEYTLKKEIIGSFKNGVYHGDINEISYEDTGDIHTWSTVTAIEGVYAELPDDAVWEEGALKGLKEEIRPNGYYPVQYAECEYLAQKRGKNPYFIVSTESIGRIHYVFGFGN